MDTRDDWRETGGCCFFDATCTSDNEWNIDTPPRTDVASDARPARSEARIMVIGFHVIRV